jgi:hypothetical protein
MKPTILTSNDITWVVINSTYLLAVLKGDRDTISPEPIWNHEVRTERFVHKRVAVIIQRLKAGVTGCFTIVDRLCSAVTVKRVHRLENSSSPGKRVLPHANLGGQIGRIARVIA